MRRTRGVYAKVPFLERPLICDVFRLKSDKVHDYDSVGVLINDNAVWIHTESTDIIFKLLCSVYDFAFV